ncbi:peptidoglycan bridge formation glycyltransferase FemA/FemB family protein [Candidatus Daviesbacteria bacterium]|nr:peptidoglycan bridge formation glycyltransferase FemA/FemB family protein [Candidatus Daviesbacteria bacterium]
MDLRVIDSSLKKEYNNLVTHVVQSWQWGEFREKLGTPIYRYGIFDKNKLVTAFTITFHKIPLTSKFIGYLPKGGELTSDLASFLLQIGKGKNAAFIKLEPNILKSTNLKIDKNFHKSPKSMFTKYNFVLDLTPSIEELLKKMHPKTRYNIRLSEKKGVKVEERVDDEALDIYLKLYFETTKRQGYFGHNETYHKKVWQTLRMNNMARLLIAIYKNIPLTAWMLFNFKDTLYYPYGGSSNLHRDVMASNLVAFEAIKLGKKLNLKKIDMWGSLGPDANPKDPWFGFHRFKQGYGGDLVEYIGTYDLVFNRPTYYLVSYLDRFTKLKSTLLRLLG